MAGDQSSTPSAQAGGLTFEVDRFDWATPDRIEVVGRWYGLRGHRFMRPVLDVSAGEDQRRLLALLEHKPWAAEDGEEWVAAFPWKGEPLDFDDAELALAPSIAVELDPPRAPGGKKRKVVPDAKRTQAAPARPDGRTLDRLERELAAAQEDREQLRAEVTLLEGRLAAERAAAERREAHRASREERAAAEERDAAIAERDAARAERDEARRAAVEARERLQAVRSASGPTSGAHERAERAEREREQAQRKAATAKERADRAEATARAEREAARAERETARTQATSAAVAPAPRGPRTATALPNVPSSPPGPPAWLARGLAVLALIVLVLVLLVLLNGSL